MTGLSPRERGNLPVLVLRAIVCGSIPARAGEPTLSKTRICCATVYPRASGGTRCSWWPAARLPGLSPRERGNPSRYGPGRMAVRSIPARAGEPHGPAVHGRTAQVYPRASGGTVTSLAMVSPKAGLSPRERGNHGTGRQQRAGGRSIPARAGEPGGTRRPATGSTVYPRASGGTVWRRYIPISIDGLSPRERGNRLESAAPAAGQRSIPARAGEPQPSVRIPRRSWVYPRASGGTGVSPRAAGQCAGLSPRERGNPLRLFGTVLPAGSIPARAGEPPTPSSRAVRSTVYPRASGGTVDKIDPW